MTDKMNPKTAKMGEIEQQINTFYQDLHNHLPKTIIDEKEQLSIPELVKRLVTLDDIKYKLGDVGENLEHLIEIPENLNELNRKNQGENKWTGWFQGDGDSIGKYFRSFDKDEESNTIKQFSDTMIKWGQEFKDRLPSEPKGRIIYAGGDDFLGVLYPDENSTITLNQCLPWLYSFPTIWSQHQQPITVSMGFVWAAGGVPQRDVLQHCKLAEQAAKKQGRDRLIIRILYNSGNYLEWGCAWWFQELLESYCEHHGHNIKSLKANWKHFYDDILTLENRHAFKGNQIDIALEIFEIYFGEENRMKLENQEYWWNQPRDEYLWNNANPIKTMGEAKETGILGEKENYYDDNKELDYEKINPTINNWVIKLANIGLKMFP